jgi:hypothetical protein
LFAAEAEVMQKIASEFKFVEEDGLIGRRLTPKQRD